MTENPRVEIGQRIVALETFDYPQWNGRKGVVTAADNIKEGLNADLGTGLRYVAVRSWRLTDPPLNPGDRVLVPAKEGVVGATSPASNAVRVDFEDTFYTWCDPAELERLSEPEPEWLPGDIVRRDSGVSLNIAVKRNDGAWHTTFLDGDGWSLSEEAVFRASCEPVVKQGKPVGGAQ